MVEKVKTKADYKREIKANYKRQALALPKETRQKVIDCIHKGGIVGDIRKECGINIDEFIGIINLNLNKKTFNLLNKEAV